MEGFSSLLRKAELSGKIRGIAVSRYAPSLSHFFFADDSLLLLRASIQDCDAITRILHTFELASGQQVNIEKSDIFFTSKTPEATRDEIMQHLGVRKKGPRAG